jgi:hypothetical protein
MLGIVVRGVWAHGVRLVCFVGCRSSVDVAGLIPNDSLAQGLYRVTESLSLRSLRSAGDGPEAMRLALACERVRP